MRITAARSALAAATLALALFTVSCAAETQATEQPPAAEGTAQESTENTAPEQNAEDFEEVELDGALVDSFPSDVPLYDGEIVNSLSAWSETSDSPEWNVLIATDDPMETVDAAIRSAYTSNGWEIRSDMESMGGYLLVAHNDDYIVSITYNDMTGGLTINYGVSTKG